MEVVDTLLCKDIVYKAYDPHFSDGIDPHSQIAFKFYPAETAFETYYKKKRNQVTGAIDYEPIEVSVVKSGARFIVEDRGAHSDDIDTLSTKTVTYYCNTDTANTLIKGNSNPYGED